MKKLILSVFLFISLLTVKAQLVSYELLKSYSIHELDSIIDSRGASAIVSAKYPVDFYQVIYMTPYKHPDSLVQVSGAITIPRNIDCPLPISAYLHGTVADRTGVPSYFSTESFIGIILATDGYMVTMPDYLGLGDCDTSVIIHPYIHAFSQANTSLNALRAARSLADSLSIDLNDEIFLGGYSQGGFSVAATHKLIQEQHSNEFTVTAAVPMSGAYDIKGAQQDLIISTAPYATPGYLPYIMLGYYSIYDELKVRYPTISHVLKEPYDSLMPALFYAKEKGIGFINGKSTPVPRDMVHDSVMNDFINDSLNPLRVVLAESHLLDWAPQAPVHLYYCNGDEQVTYLNSERAYDSWTTNGAPNVEKTDFGNFTHGDCVQFAVLNAKAFMDSYRTPCTTGIFEEIRAQHLKLYPNPAVDFIMISVPQEAVDQHGMLTITNLAGQEVMRKNVTSTGQVFSTTQLEKGLYIVEVKAESSYRSKLIISE